MKKANSSKTKRSSASKPGLPSSMAGKKTSSPATKVAKKKTAAPAPAPKKAAAAKSAPQKPPEKSSMIATLKSLLPKGMSKGNGAAKEKEADKKNTTKDFGAANKKTSTKAGSGGKQRAPSGGNRMHTAGSTSKYSASLSSLRGGSSAASDSGSESVCREIACEGLGTANGYCRLHYIKNWKKIKRKELILREKKLNQYIEELVAKYPDKYIEAIRQDLANDKDFAKVIHDLDLDESVDDFDVEAEATENLIDNIRRDFEDEGEGF